MAVQKVTDEYLVQFQSEITGNFDSLKGQLQQLQGVIDSLEGNWKGIGHGAFDAKQAEINQGMVRIAKMLLHFQEAIEVTRVTAGNTDDEVRAALQGVDVVGGYSGDAAATNRATSNLSSY
ncbi:WXG100 family type VII secretion target [Streptomyces yaizuensis]|uniref:WXG100 family type VII secretion target n=1 Tax=Streptomyces yaizuensis TaxID=2989713 RepID=A0ABQ5P914_9ACTN|nr:WXG100 family type VII secretion target [Streptomyces sp. YSPA8]GLF99074.1 WXG100 family type VII secretion target [Streptomyces sp. YSPA8]